MEIFEFFRKVSNNDISQLDTLDFIEQKTNNQLERLKILLSDLEKFEIENVTRIAVDNLTGSRNNEVISDSIYQLREIIENKIIESSRKNKISEKELTQLYYNSISHFDTFKKIMTDLENKQHYNKLIRKWHDAEQTRIISSNLQEVDKGLLTLFRTFLTDIFQIYYDVNKFRETYNEKYSTKVTIHKCRFDLNVRKQTDWLINNLNLCITSNKMDTAIRRKKHAISLFFSVERLLGNACIIIEKSPFNEIFLESKTKIEKAINNDEIRLIIEQNNGRINETIEKTPEELPPHQVTEPNEVKEKKYPDIFKDLASYKLFDTLCLTSKGTDKELAEFSFIYRMMHSEELIKEYIKPEMFKTWLRGKPYEIDLDHKLKTLDNCTTADRKKYYKMQKAIIGIP